MESAAVLLFVIALLASAVFFIKAMIETIQKKSSEKSRKIFFVSLGVAVISLVLFAAVTPKEKDKKEDSKQQNVENEVSEKKETEENESTSMSIETFKTICDATVKSDNYDYYDSHVNDDGSLTIEVGNEGVATAVYLMTTTENQELYDFYAKMKESMGTLSQTLYDTAKQMNVENPIIFLNVVNDLNTENTLLMFMNGVCVFDVTEE